MYFSSIENQYSQHGQWWKYFLSGIDNQCGQCSQWWNYFSYCFEYQHSQCSYGKTILHVVFKISIVSANEWWNYFSSDIENQHSQRNERWNYFSSDIENQRSQLTQWWNYFWTPSGRRKGQDKIGSVRPSVRPSNQAFSWDFSISFFWIFAWRYNLYKLCVTDLDFLGKIFFAQKFGKVDQRWAKNRVFFNILKDLVINFYWICSLMKTI